MYERLPSAARKKNLIFYNFKEVIIYYDVPRLQTTASQSNFAYTLHVTGRQNHIDSFSSATFLNN